MVIDPALVTSSRSSATKITRNKEQVNGAVMTVEHWTHAQRCQFIERILPSCTSTQIDTLWTVLQPSLHRDYFYAVKSRYPHYHFQRISTPLSRILKECYQRSFDREESFYLNATDDLRQIRDDDGLTKRSQSSFAQYSEEKSSSSIQSFRFPPPSIKHLTNLKNERYPATLRSLDTSTDRRSKQKISCRFKPNTARSITSIPSMTSFTTASSAFNSKQLLGWFIHNWSESEQNDFLHRLIVKFDERQQYFTSCAIEKRRHRDFISLLPGQIGLQILSYLSPKELCYSRRVCKNWKIMVDREPNLWRPKDKSIRMGGVTSKTNTIDWENMEKKRLITKHNWLTGKAHVIKCRGHTHRVLCICGNATHLATGSLDRKINIWLLTNGRLYQTLIGHSKGVWCLRFLSSLLLISGAHDSTIKIWNIISAVCVRTLLAHNGPVWALACSISYCLSGSHDRTARLWSLPKYELRATLTGHTSSVFSVDLNQEQNLCATASADKTVRLWSLSAGLCLKVLHTTTDDCVMSVSLQHGYLAFAFSVRIVVYRVNITEMKTCMVQKLMETQEHCQRIESVQLVLLDDDDKRPSLVSAGQDGLVKYWNLNSNASQHTFNVHNRDVVKINCIYVDRSHIVTANDDCTVKIMDFSS